VIVWLSSGTRRWGRFGARPAVVNPLDQPARVPRALRRQAANARGGSAGIPERLYGGHVEFARGIEIGYAFGPRAGGTGCGSSPGPAPASTFMQRTADGFVGANFAQRPIRPGTEEESCLWVPGAVRGADGAVHAINAGHGVCEAMLPASEPAGEPMTPFTPEVVGAITRHMNEDHAADSLLIVRMIGGLPEATAAVMTGLDATGADFACWVDERVAGQADGHADGQAGQPLVVRIPWSERLTERAQVRAEVVRLYGEARRRAAARPDRFSARLRTATRGEHGDTEQAEFLTALLDGRLSREQYAALAGQLYHVYDVLEEAADHLRHDEVASRFDLPGLRRREALQADLEFYLGPSWPDRIAPHDATRRYCDRLRAICFDWPAGFVAHHYTRYLGDLSGGQAIAVRIAQTYDLTDPEGVRFYRFEEKPKRLKDRYRSLLDTAPWDRAEQDRIIDEVRVAYRLNGELAASLTP
jgi:heme oxygenase (biliverdin-producing, ferredoxin)